MFFFNRFKIVFEVNDEYIAEKARKLLKVYIKIYIIIDNNYNTLISSGDFNDI